MKALLISPETRSIEEIDISGMDVGDSLHLTDLNLPAGVELLELARGEGHDLGVEVPATRIIEAADRNRRVLATGENVRRYPTARACTWAIREQA